MLTVANISVTYEGSRILRGVNLTVPERSLVCLMGRNGVGKTTTLKSIVGLARVDGGEVTLAGLESQWQSGNVTDEMFYRLAPGVEAEVKKLRTERARWEMENAAGSEEPADIIRRWRSGEYDLAQRRKILFDVFVAIQVVPGQKGSRKPDPNRLKPIWR